MAERHGGALAAHLKALRASAVAKAPAAKSARAAAPDAGKTHGRRTKQDGGRDARGGPGEAGAAKKRGREGKAPANAPPGKRPATTAPKEAPQQESTAAVAAFIERLMATDARDVDVQAVLASKLKGRALVLEDDAAAPPPQPAGPDSKGARRWRKRCATRALSRQAAEDAGADAKATAPGPPAQTPHRPWHARWKRARAPGDRDAALARAPATIATAEPEAWAGKPVRVVEHADASLVGLRGIVDGVTPRAVRVRLASSSRLATPRAVAVVPKRRGVFAVRVAGACVLVAGDALLVR